MGLRILGRLVFFDIHVFELTRLEDLSALDALHELKIFLPSDNLDTGVLA